MAICLNCFVLISVILGSTGSCETTGPASLNLDLCLKTLGSFLLRVM